MKDQIPHFPIPETWVTLFGAELDRREPRADSDVHMAYRSITTVKADVVRRWFQAEGDGIVWAVVDSGIDGSHPHFRSHANLTLPEPVQHRDFFVRSGDERPLVDEFGHGTHVAGIIAGEMTASSGPMIVLERTKDTDGNDSVLQKTITAISGMAPKTKLLSLKVLDENGSGSVSSVLAALAYIDELNDHGRRLRIHGVNLSLGYDWDVESFACGQSPLCITVNRLVQTGVLVVVAAGNTGFGYQNSLTQGPVAQGLELSINDPGNAELALTVGSTHRDQPFVYGVSVLFRQRANRRWPIQARSRRSGRVCGLGCPAGGRSHEGQNTKGRQARQARIEDRERCGVLL